MSTYEISNERIIGQQLKEIGPQADGDEWLGTAKLMSLRIIKEKYISIDDFRLRILSIMAVSILIIVAGQLMNMNISICCACRMTGAIWTVMR